MRWTHKYRPGNHRTVKIIFFLVLMGRHPQFTRYNASRRRLLLQPDENQIVSGPGGTHQISFSSVVFFLDEISKKTAETTDLPPETPFPLPPATRQVTFLPATLLLLKLGFSAWRRIVGNFFLYKKAKIGFSCM